MHNTINLTEDLYWIGANNRRLSLFENVYPIPKGVSYNSYVLLDEKTVLLDTIDQFVAEQFFENLEHVLNGRKLDYLIVNHMEPDHCSQIKAITEKYKGVKIVCNPKTKKLIEQFFDLKVAESDFMIVKEGDVLNTGKHNLTFVFAPMVHWPEVMMSYCHEEQVFFSADAFGKFGVYGADTDDWACEARRYYFNIVGKYGTPVSMVLKKTAALAIKAICPLHGYILEGEQLAEALRLYNIWSKYEVETKGVLIAHASIHGNTAKAAEELAEMLRAKGAGKVVVTDLCRDDMAEAIEDAFRMDKMVVCASSYDNNVFPPMHQFLWKLQQKAYQNRTVGIVENGSWAPSAGREMKALLETMKNVTIVEPMVTIRSSLNQESRQALAELAEKI